MAADVSEHLALQLDIPTATCCICRLSPAIGVPFFHLGATCPRALHWPIQLLGICSRFTRWSPNFKPNLFRFSEGIGRACPMQVANRDRATPRATSSCRMHCVVLACKFCSCAPCIHAVSWSRLSPALNQSLCSMQQGTPGDIFTIHTAAFFLLPH